MGVFSKVGGMKPGRTAFNLRHSNLCDMKFGALYPVDCIECVPGDKFKLDVSVVARLASALKSPILADMDLILEAFFTPTRLLMGSDANFDVPVGERNFEEFLVGGKDGKEVISLPLLSTVGGGVRFNYGGISDYLGIQPDVNFTKELKPIAFPWRAYRWIWNEYYRNEFLQDPIQVCQFLGSSAGDDKTVISNDRYDTLLYRGWRRDYFTSALPYQQFGTAPAFQLEGTLPVTLTPSGYFNINDPEISTTGADTFHYVTIKDGTGAGEIVSYSPSGKLDGWRGTVAEPGLVGSVNLNDAVTFDVADIRTAFQIQKWMERNARGGVRYTEYLRSHFGVSPSDARLQRPQFIGSYRMPWLISEVLQTSSSTGDQPQGQQAGQGIALGRGSLGSFTAYEFGYIMVIASIVPKPQYQQGIPRMFSRRVALDFYSPEFAHLSEQAILNKELFVSGDVEVDNKEFGFQGIWNELRYLPSRVSNHMRSGNSEYSFDYWHLARKFATTPVLNSEFLQVGATAEAQRELQRIFPVQDENPFIVNFGFNFKAVRPLPYLAEPGLVDHF